MDKRPTSSLMTAALNKLGVDEVAKRIHVAKGTILKWIESKNVPVVYRFDFLKILNLHINYTLYSSKDKDQFFTPLSTASYCYGVFCRKMKALHVDTNKYVFIEPSAGDGSFMNALRPRKVIGLDIEPRRQDILKQDYLQWSPKDKTKKYIVFGNPPFGMRGNLALRFINHSHSFADFVCFILPQLFESDGKGVPRKRVEGYNLIHTEKLNTKFYSPGNPDDGIVINVVFQIWSKHLTNPLLFINEKENEFVKVVSLSDGGTPSTTRNKSWFNRCDIYLPSTCFGMENMKCYKSFNTLPGRRGYGVVFLKDKKKQVDKSFRIIWSAVCFLSTNSALNLRKSMIQAQYS